MRKKCGFLGFFVSLFIVLFSANAFAGGYTCTRTFTNCSAGYYLTDTKLCLPCSAPYTKSAGGTGGINSCYLVTEPGKFVETPQGAQVTCKKGGYCPGNVTVYYGGTGGRTAASKGYYVDSEGATSQKQCSAGTYTSSTGQSSCSTIKDGCWGGAGATSDCPNNCNALTAPAVTGGTFSSVTPRSANTACRYKAPSKSDDQCSSITANTVSYSGSAWGTNFYTSTAKAGSYVTATGNTSAPACALCAKGTYTTAANTSTSCTAASKGYYVDSEGATSQKQCSAGTYTSSTGQSSCSTITNGCYGSAGATAACPNNCNALTAPAVAGGTFSSVTPRSANTQCRYTAPNQTIAGCKTVTPNAVSYDGKAWGTNFYSVTANGGYIIANNNTASATCTQCGAGKYSGGGTATSCSSCPTNSTSDAGSDAIADCKCKAGYGGNAGTSGGTCTACECGYYKGSAGNSSCTKTTAGYYAAGTGNTGQTKATAGNYAAAGSCEQTACPTNSSSPAGSDGREDCSCNAGYGGDAATGSCTACVCGTYKSSAGNTICTTTTAGYYATGTGNTSQTMTDAGNYAAAGACKQTKADPGYYAAAGASSQTACPTNSSSPAGSDGREDCSCNAGYGGDATTGSCTACECGYYKGSAGNSSCTKTTAGYYATGKGNTSQKKTDAGYYAAAGACSQTKVDAGCYGSAGATSKCPNSCPNNSSSPAGSDEKADCSCNAGYGGNATTGSCTACECGYYKGSAGNSSCTKTTAGYYATGTGNTSQKKTDAGYYAAAGACSQTKVDAGCYGSAGATSKCPNSCPNNSSSPAGSDARADCSCNAGYGGDAATGSCTACACGTYKSSAGNTICTTTTAGYYATGTGNTGQTKTNAGYYAAAGACEQTKVDAGCYGSAGATSKCPNSCPTNSSSPAGSDERADCSCNAGYGGNAATGSCTACACGTYKSSAGNTNCTTTSPGYYANGTGNTGQTKTDAGYYAAAGACEQTACATGSYQANTGASSCTACDAGKTNTGTANTKCASTCSDADYVSTWKTTTWSNNTVANLCVVDTYKSYTISYSCGSGSGTAPTKGSATYNSNFTPAANSCTYTGYNFAGWTVSGTSGDVRAAGTAFKWTYTENKTFTAKWTAQGEQTITYNTNGGTINGSYTAACNVETATFTLPTNVTKPGYTFDGWYANSSFTGSKVTSVTKGSCTSALTYYAKWTACNKTTAGACNCEASEYPLNGVCTNCTYSCSSVTGFTLGSYNVCNSQTNNICYRNCIKSDVLNSTSVSGTVTKGGTNTCKATACNDDYYISGSGCQSCPENATCGGEAEWECDAGYQKTANGLGCEPRKYTVTLNVNGGTGGTASVTATFGATLPAATMPTRTNYNFLGYYDTDAETGGNQYYNQNGAPVKAWTTAGTGTLYARWKLGIFTCTAGKDADGNACAAGSYCPGGNVTAGTENNTTNGCERKCPSASGKTISSPSSATQITQCTAAGTVDITNESGTVAKSGTGTKTCNWNANNNAYDASCNIVPTSCIGGYYRSSQNSPFCNEVGRGYYRAATDNINTRSACSSLSGGNGGTTTKIDIATTPNACYNVCSDQTTNDGNGILDAKAEEVFYNGSTIPACEYTTQCNTGYKVSGTNSQACEPKVLAITLNHNGGTSSTNTIYLKYNTGWYSDNAAKNKITSVAVPTLTGQTFGGYLSGNEIIVTSGGALTTKYSVFSEPATIKASWGQNPSITCAAGTYYGGTGTTCTSCPAGSYCGGVTVIQDTNEESGRATCASLNGSYTAATNASGQALAVTVSSPAKSTSAADCYATNVAYKPNNYTSGSQTCKYDASKGSYSASCYSKLVITCGAGYAKANDQSPECTIVAVGSYSPDKDTKSYKCPMNADTGTYGTTQEAGRSSAEACIMDNLWYEPENGHSGQRRQCWYSNTTKKYDRNCPQSTIVTCDAGYYYDAAKSTSDCVPVGNGYWSPAQSACSGEALQPSEAGCSTKRNYCGAGVNTKDPDGNITDTASNATYCEGMCEEDYFCVPGKEPQSCSKATGGEFPYSAPGATSVNQCYAIAENCSCIQNEDLCQDMYNANSCVFAGETYNGAYYYSDPNTCAPSPKNPDAANCSVTTVYCKSNYYFEPVGNLTSGSCKLCKNLSSYHEYSSSLKATSNAGSSICYARVDLPCTPPVCPLADRGTCDYDADHAIAGGGRTYYGTDTIVGGTANPYTCPSEKDNSKPADWSCFTGYDKNTNGTTPEDLCVPHVYTFTLDDNGGSGGAGTVYMKYGVDWYSNAAATNKVSKVTKPERQYYSFAGYYTAKTSGQQIINSDGQIVGDTNFTSDTTLYAQWSQDSFQCVAGKSSSGAACPVGRYCPARQVPSGGGELCAVACPEGGATMAAGQSDITSCHKSFKEGDTPDKVFDNGTATWDCTWVGNETQGSYAACSVTVDECEAGYYQAVGTKACSPVEAGYWSPDKQLSQTQCPVPAQKSYTVGSDDKRDEKADCYIACDSYSPTVDNSVEVYRTPGENNQFKHFVEAEQAYASCEYTVKCESGYDAVNGISPRCDAREYTITLDVNGGSGTIADSVKCTFDTGKCALPATSALSKAGYLSADKWCEKSDGTGACYAAGVNATANISSTGQNITLYAIWKPAVFKVTLVAPDATANATHGPIYLKYNTGWYSDAAAQTPITSIGATNTLPQKTGYTFGGYKIGDVFVVTADGKLSNAWTVTTADATATATWAAGATHCDAGTYYSGQGSVCLDCKENHYCGGGDFATDNGEAGLDECPNGGLSSGGKAATSAAVCYKEKMPYVSSTENAKGTHTCYFETVGYTNCQTDSIEIDWCSGGHWYNEAQSTTDCVAVGAGYYSANGDMTREICPLDGGTDNGTSDELADCSKRVRTYASDAQTAQGSWICRARLDGNEFKYDYNCARDTIEIDWCAAGHWYDETQSTTDCVHVGNNNYGPVANADGDMINKAACPHGGTTTITNASTPDGTCRKEVVYPGPNYEGVPVHGSGVQGCFYDSKYDGKDFGTEVSDGYLSSCVDLTITICDNGYYWDRVGDVCQVVGKNHYGPVVDTANGNNNTGRSECPDNGITDSETSVEVSACYLEKVACDIVNGSGENTCHYDAELQTYSDCTTCEITKCDDGYSPVGGGCINCPANNVCANGVQRTCAEATGGKYSKADAGTTDVAYCYTDCALGANASTMSGRDYNGAPDTCVIESCVAGYHKQNGTCVKCPAGSVCDPSVGGEPKTCAELTNGEYPMSNAGATSVNDCYKACEGYEVENGTALPKEDTVSYPNECEFYGKSTTGNPCDIIDGVCIETSCNYNYELINGVCKPCARDENAIEYKENGNCVVASCKSGYHPNGYACESNTIECSAPNAVVATQTWNFAKNAFGACIITECESGYHVAANACQIDEQVCELEHGIGVREWNHKTNNWGECIATKCDPGYTNDRSLTNELSKQCGRCNNMYAANGDRAASAYVEECEIAACMYQGEKYTLENNECVLVCDEYSDETGSRMWDDKRKRCVRTCEPGYTEW